MATWQIMLLLFLSSIWSLFLFLGGFMLGQYMLNESSLPIEKIVTKLRRIQQPKTVAPAGIKPPTPEQVRLMRKPDEQIILERQKELLS